MAKKSKAKTEKKPDSSPPAPVENVDIRVNEMGQIVKNFDIDKINEFLNANVADKKLSGDG
jgi:hypothetical protein